jgi:two-component system sensor histidine kinase PilS (NtrC family)
VRIRVAQQSVDAGVSTVLSVKDQGVGIKREDLAHIFEPFYSTKRGGTGLGLATVARIVEDHRGHIEIDSLPGRGTEFVVRFPHVLVEARRG